MTFVPSPEALRGLDADDLPGCVRQALRRRGTVTSSSELAGEDYAALVLRLLGDDSVAFAGLDDAEVRQCIARSNIIRCAPGDRILRAGGSARNIFVLLDGQLEACDNSGTIGSIEPGEMFGEMAFLTRQPGLSVDLYASASRVQLPSTPFSACSTRSTNVSDERAQT